MNIDPRQLFAEDSDAAFAGGAAARLVVGRTAGLGNLLLAERRVFYVQVLYGLLRLRRQHQVEPLHDDLYAEVRAAQEAMAGEEGYGPDRFREDLDALREWGLLDQRMEPERIRGYRDSRRHKFRYMLRDETVAFLEWLEERLQDDLDDRGADTRDLLEEVAGALQELGHVLYRVGTARAQDGDARRALFQLARLDQLTHAVTGELVTLNARMLGFVPRPYTVADARQVLAELDTFVGAFLGQVHALRGAITERLGAVTTESAAAKIRACAVEMEAERRQAPHFARRMRDAGGFTHVPAQLAAFYRSDGLLDEHCRRIGTTARQVWHKLHRHLRELDRKSHRLEDLRARIAEVAALPSDAVPHTFLRELLAPAHLATDPQYWDAHEKANPPEPRRTTGRRSEHPRVPLPGKTRHDGPVRTMEHRRLELLMHWLEQHVIAPGVAEARVADGVFEGFDDLARVIELAKVGQLGRGRRLAGVGFALQVGSSRDALEAGDCTLETPALRVRRGGTHGGA